MSARAGTWSELGQGVYIQDSLGVIWKVVAQAAGQGGIWTQLINREGHTVSQPPRPPDFPVTILVPDPAPTMEQAEALVAGVLGGEVEGRQVESKPWRLRPFPTSGRGGGMSRARSHIWMEHGIYVDDVKTFEGLLECHNDSHEDPDPLYVRPHFHDLTPR